MVPPFYLIAGSPCLLFLLMILLLSMLLIQSLVPTTGRGRRLLCATLVAVGDVGELQLDVVGIGEEDTVIESRK